MKIIITICISLAFINSQAQDPMNPSSPSKPKQVCESELTWSTNPSSELFSTIKNLDSNDWDLLEIKLRV